MAQYRKPLFLAWIICLASIPFLSYFGRPLQLYVSSIFSSLQLTIFLNCFSAALFIFALKQSTNDNSKSTLLEILILIVLFLSINFFLLPVERIHICLFGTFGFLSHKLFGTKVALCLLFAISGLDELFQHYLPDRVGDWRDVLTNVSSSLLGLRLSCVLAKNSDASFNNQ